MKTAISFKATQHLWIRANAISSGIPQDENGNEVEFFWEASAVQKNTIEAFRLTLLFTTGQHRKIQPCWKFGAIAVPSFPPYFLRKINLPELQDELRILKWNRHRKWFESVVELKFPQQKAGTVATVLPQKHKSLF